MPAYTTTLLTVKGEVRKANLTLDEKGLLTVEAIQKYLRKKEAPEPIGSVSDKTANLVLTFFGYKKGKSDTQNMTGLPAALKSPTLFGDVLIIAAAKHWSLPVPYLPAAWDAFKEAIEENEEEEAEGEAEEAEEGDAEEEADDVEEEEEEAIDEEEPAEEDDEDGFQDDGFDDGEDMKPEPVVTRRSKAMPVNLTMDTAAFKEELPLDTPATSYPIRQTCLKQLQFLAEWFDTEAIIRLEKAVLAASAAEAKKLYIPRNWKSTLFCDLYKSIARTVLWNIHPKSPIGNRRLLERCKEGEFPLDNIPTMTAYDMFPEHWRELADKLLVREQKILEGNKSRATDEYKCKRCGKRECTYYEMQTRSADEPTTIFISCLNCGQRWRH
jgi:hypothetical protein